MARFWKREGEFSELERQLRAERPEPRVEIMEQVARRLRPERSFLAYARMRFAIASSLTAVTLVVFAALGGVGQATTLTKQLVGISPAASTSAAPAKAEGTSGSSASQPSQGTQSSQAAGSASAAQGQDSGNTGSDSLASNEEQSAQDQYGEKVTICHRPDGKPANAKTLRVSSAAAAQHLRDHPLDTAGPCP